MRAGWRRYLTVQSQEAAGPTHWTLGAAIGIVAGFITLVANAAGPLMALYLVAMRLPKMQFVGTTAVFFMVLNLFKVPFMVKLGLVTAQSFEFNLMLAPAVLLGAFAGRWLLIRINQRLFEQMVLGFSAIAGILVDRVTGPQAHPKGLSQRAFLLISELLPELQTDQSRLVDAVIHRVSAASRLRTLGVASDFRAAIEDVVRRTVRC